MGITIPVDDWIIKRYLSGSPASDYSGHWVYREAQGGLANRGAAFKAPPEGYEDDVAILIGALRQKLNNFTFRNHEIVEHLFDSDLARLDGCIALPTVGFFADAVTLLHEGAGYAVFDLIHMANYVRSGKELDALLQNLLTHEFCHLLMGLRYPPGNFSYTDYLDWISFHEGFAHLLAYRDNIQTYQLDAEYTTRYETAREQLSLAIDATAPDQQAEYSRSVNAGNYWDKFGAIASMLYLLAHIDRLSDIYNAGWQGYCNKIINY